MIISELLTLLTQFKHGVEVRIEDPDCYGVTYPIKRVTSDETDGGHVVVLESEPLGQVRGR